MLTKEVVHEDLRKLYPPELTSRVRITLFDVAPTVLPMFERALSDYATNLFRRSGIQMRTETGLEGIEPVEDEDWELEPMEDVGHFGDDDEVIVIDDD